MKVVTVHTPAKLNLTLQIFQKRKDGFHEIETVMQAINLWDTIEIRGQGAGGRGQGRKENTISIKCFPKRFNVPENENNLCYKAADLFLKEAGVTGSKVHISIRKKIPPGSGLGGGSGNAAGCIEALNRLFPRKVSKRKRALLAGKIGSDAPYFLHGGLAVCRGRGERVLPQPASADFFVALALPDFSLSTKKVYENLPLQKTHKKSVKPSRLYSARFLEALHKRGFNKTGDLLRNDLEKSRLTALKKVRSIKQALRKAGAEGSAMSGSGSCVYGVFSSRKKAERAAEILHSSLKSCKIVRTRAIPDGVKITS